MMAAILGKSHALPGAEDIHRQVLSNGITVLARPNFNSSAVSVSGYLHAGSLAEPDDKLGLADFVASALMRGTQRRDFDQIYDELEAVGATFGYDSGTHTTSFGGRSLAEDLGLLLGLFGETLRTPVFPEAEIERLRAQLLTGLAIRAQDTSDMADLVFDEVLFENHPYARPADGWPRTILAITRQDLLDFHASFFGPRGMVIAIVGGIEPARAVEAVERVLGSWQPGGQKAMPPLPPVQALAETVRRHHSIPGKSQTDLVVGTLGPRRADPEYFSAALGNSVLGQFGMMGRIGEVVREKAGLAYYAYSSMSAGMGPGTWSVSAGVNPSKVKKTVSLILRELKRFTQKGVTRRELGDCQSNFIGRLPLSLESNAGVAAALLNIQRHDLGLDYYRKYPECIRRVTREDVVETARRYIDPDRLVITSAGP
ncbi:MAG: M16 family metallopeptidase [Bacteroidota bacterium]